MFKIAFLLVLLLSCSTVPAQTIWHVSSTAPPLGSGTAASPFNSITSAMTSAQNGDTILVAPGIYLENVNFLGKAVSLRSTSGALATTIDGGGVFWTVGFVTGETATSLLRGFTIRNGAFIDGAGVHCASASPTIEDCLLENNIATNNGGALLCYGGSPTIRRCSFVGNSAGIDGGAIHFFNGTTATVSDCLFSANTPAMRGGSLRIENSSPTITNCRFENHNLAGDGGAVFLNGISNAVFRRCTFHNNMGGFGGAASLEGGLINFDSCIFTQNSGLASGGAVSLGFGTANFVNCIFANNFCNGFGGGLYINSSTVTVLHCTFRANTAGSGGGLYTFFGSVPTVTNSVFWANVGGQIVSNSGQGGIVSFCDVEGGFLGAGNINADPQFVDPSNLDFHLTATSPCRNTGTALAPLPPATDFEGNPRTLSLIPDMGADEFAPTYAGTTDDILLTTLINGAGGGVIIKPAPTGSFLNALMTTPNNSLLGAIPLIVGTLYANATPPPPILPDIHIDFANFVFFVDGSAPPPFFVATLTSAGTGFGASVPPGLTGFTLRLQGAALTPLAANASYATTAAHELVF